MKAVARKGFHWTGLQADVSDVWMYPVLENAVHEYGCMGNFRNLAKFLPLTVF